MESFYHYFLPSITEKLQIQHNGHTIQILHHLWIFYIKDKNNTIIET